MKNPICEFDISPLPRSRFVFRVRIWDNVKDMERQAVADGSMSGKAHAAFNGFEPHEIRGNKIGELYLHNNSSFFSDAIHEILHAAVHYTRDIRKKSVDKISTNDIATDDEELLCECMESLVRSFSVQLGKYAQRIEAKK